jgi:GMP synthase (glutamine-hydrolysing)
MKLIEEAMKNLPVLGICLGAQLIAKTLGADVYANKEKEIGWYDVSPTDHAENDPLLMIFQTTEKIFQWHGETFDIPKALAISPFLSLCANQAFRYDNNVYGFQFHLEVDERMIHRWFASARTETKSPRSEARSILSGFTRKRPPTSRA